MSNNNIPAVGALLDSTITVERQFPCNQSIAKTLGQLQFQVTEHVNDTYGVKLDPYALRGKYYPSGADTNDKLSVLGSEGLKVIFEVGGDQKDDIRNRVVDLCKTEAKTKRVADILTTHLEKRKGGKDKGKQAESTSNGGADKDWTMRILAAFEGMRQEAKQDREAQNLLVKDLRDDIKKQDEKMKKQDEKMEEQNERIKKQDEKIKIQSDIIGSLQDQVKRHENRIDVLEGEATTLNRTITTLTQSLNAEKSQHMSDMETLREVTVALTPLHLRVLLDLNRKRILQLFERESWEELRLDMTIAQLVDTISRRVADLPLHPSYETIKFLCSYNNVRRAGNTAAHAAGKEQIRDAVLRETEEKNRRCLEQLFEFTYNEKV